MKDTRLKYIMHDGLYYTEAWCKYCGLVGRVLGKREQEKAAMRQALEDHKKSTHHKEMKANFPAHHSNAHYATRFHDDGTSKPKTDPTYSAEWSGRSGAPVKRGVVCERCGGHVHNEAGNAYCPDCDDYVRTVSR